MGADPRERLYEQGRQVGTDARALVDDVRDMADEATGFLRDQVERRPYLTLGAAATVGYVLGGGVPRWMVRAAVTVGGRMLVGAVLGEVLGGDVEAAPGPSGPEAP